MEGIGFVGWSVGGFVGRSGGGVVGLEGRGQVRTARRAPVARMKNAGGFRLPPRVPEQRELLTRAYELLGNRTQRKLNGSAESDLESLIGTVPRTKEAAQRYKAAIELQMRKEYRVNNGVLLATPLTRTKYMDIIRMPESETDINRCFSMLQAIRRRGTIASSTYDELETLIGIVPKDAREARRASNALKRLVRERHRRERYPPRVPQSDEELTTSLMLIGMYASRGTAGRRNAELRRLLGDLPRNRSIATYWKKFIQMHIRKNKRSALVKARRALADMVREQRRQKREARAALEATLQSGEGVEATPEAGARLRPLLAFLAVAIILGALGGPHSIQFSPNKLRAM